MTVGLVYAEMQAAAQAVADTVDPLHATLRELGGDVETAAAGFKGQAAAGFGQALNAWFEVAVSLGPALEDYADAIMALAQEHATNDHQQAVNAGRLADRLGGIR